MVYERTNGSWALSGKLYSEWTSSSMSELAASVAISDDGLTVALGEGRASGDGGERSAFCPEGTAPTSLESQSAHGKPLRKRTMVRWDSLSLETLREPVANQV